MTSPKKTSIYDVLTREFDQGVIQQKGRFSYISHGLITQRLTEADPHWYNTIDDVFTYNDAQGVLHCGGAQMTLCLHIDGETVCRSEGGGPQRAELFALEFKNACSDALKRCAMRFGVALSLWEDLTESQHDEDYRPQQRASVPSRNVANGQPTGDRRVSGASTPIPATEADRETLRQLSYKLGEQYHDNVALSHEQAVTNIKEMSGRLNRKEAQPAARA